MLRNWKALALAFGVALLVGALGIGAALAADPQPTATSGQDVYLGKVARILGIDQQKLTDAFTQARLEMIDDAVAAGQITRERADWLKQGIQQGFVGKGGFHGRFGGRMGGWHGGMGRAPTAPATPTAPAQ